MAGGIHVHRRRRSACLFHMFVLIGVDINLHMSAVMPDNTLHVSMC